MGLAYPFIGPVLVGALVTYLEAKGANVVPAPVNPACAVRTGQFDTALIIPPYYESRFESGRQAAVHLVVDSLRLSAVLAMSWTLAALGDYSAEVSNIRLKALGLDAAVAVPLRIKQLNVTVGRNLTGFFLNMRPPFQIFIIFMGGVYLAIDTTSEEREQGSLEPLLANPVARWELMLGKALAAMVFTAMAVIVQLIAFKLVFEVITWGEYGLEVDLGLGKFVTAFFVCLPLMVLAVAVQIIVATLTRSYKETQTYLGLLPLVPFLPGLVLVFVSDKAHPWMMAIPTFGQTLLISQLDRGEPVSKLDVALAAMTTSLAGALLLLLAARLYDRDALLFGAQ